MANAANIVKLKRSAVAGKAPNTADLQLGELALNTYDGRLFFTTTQDSGSTYNLTTLQPFPTGGSSGQVLSLDSYGNLIWSTTSGTGTVTSVSVVSANGFTGTVATSGTTPAITIATSVTGLLKGNGTSISAATASTDYVIPSDLSSYVTSTSLSSTLGSYVTSSSLSSTLSSYVTSSSLSSTLSSYVTSSTLSSYNYISLTSLSTDTPGTASGTGSIAYDNATGKFKYTPPDLSSYVTSTSLSSTLGSYVTSTSLSSTLSSYVTSSTLSSYNYITLASLSMDTPASASGSGNVQYDSATGKFKYTPPDLSSYLTASSTLDASKLSGTIPSTVLGNSTVYIGTTAVALNRSSAIISLTGTSIDGNAATVTDGVYTTGSYSDPTWLTITKSKVGLGNVENTALSTWAGSTNITTLGTITSGVWHGSTIDNTYLTNTTIQLNGVTLTLGDTGKTIKASTTNALTISTGLTGTSFDGSSAVTIAVDTTTIATRSYVTGLNYITLASLSMDTPASASGSGNVQYDSATGKFKYTPPDLSSYITASVATLSSLTSIGTTGVDTTAAGNLIVSGNLTVNGTTETINSTTSTFADKNIELAKPVSPATASDSGANGGGITLHGTTDKTLNWVLSTLAWTSSENFDIANNKTYKINGTDVLSSTALGTAVTGSSLTSVGTITSGVWHGTAIANSYLANSTIVVNGVTLTLGDTSVTIKASTTNALTIGTGLSGTSFDGSSAVTIALATGYGDTQNPYASKTAKYILAAPNSTNGAPTFRALVASDIPTLNQDTTGNAGTVTNGVYTTGSYADPGWITSLSQTKVLPTQTGNNGFYLTTNGTTATWTAFPTASTTQLGGVKVDGTTITINNGVISSAGSGGGSLTTSSFDYWAGILIMG